MRIISTAAIAAVFVLLSYGVFWARQRIRNTPASNHQDRPLRIAAIVCLVLFILINLSDWPGTVLAQYWAEHAILAATASTLPLVCIGYFAFEAHDQRAQDRLDSRVAATGRGGVVDHLVDIDVALALLDWDHHRVKGRWPDFDTGVRSLTWLRHDRQLIGRGPDEVVLATDPRATRLSDDLVDDGMHRGLADECIRRVMVGIKQWGPILAQSSDGERDLIDLGEIRLALLPIVDRSRPLDPSEIRALQSRCRALALSFEKRSGAGRHVRPEVLRVTEAAA